MSADLVVEGVNRLMPLATSPGKETTADNPVSQFSEETKQEVYGIAEKILAAAAEKSSGETEKKLIAAVMAVHMKYAESLQVIENLIRDRKKIDERVKYLETQLRRSSKTKKAKTYKDYVTSEGATTKPPGYSTAPVDLKPNKPLNRNSDAITKTENEKKVNSRKQRDTADDFGVSKAPGLADSTKVDSPKQEAASSIPELAGGDECTPDDPDEVAVDEEDLPILRSTDSPKIVESNNDEYVEDELFVIKEGNEATEEDAAPPLYPGKRSSKRHADPLKIRKSEIKNRLAELYEMPLTNRATPRSSTASAADAFPSRPTTAPSEGRSRSPGTGNGSRRPSSATTGPRKVLGVREEIEALEQELHEIEQKIRFHRASIGEVAEFSGMKERELVMKKRAEDRLAKSRARVEAEEKAKLDAERKEEERAKRRIERAKQSGGHVEEGGVTETWEQRLERENREREERKMKHKAAVLASRTPLTRSLEESINVFKETKGKNASDPPKPKIEPIKAEDPAAIAARIAREAARIEAAQIKKEKENEERIKNMAVTPDHPTVVAMKQRAEAAKAKADQKAEEQRIKRENEEKEKERQEKLHFESILAQKGPDVKPTNAQISRDLEVKRAEEAKILELKQKEAEEKARLERQEEIKRKIKASKNTNTNINRIVLGSDGKALNADDKNRPSLTERFEKYHQPHLH